MYSLLMVGFSARHPLGRIEPHCHTAMGHNLWRWMNIHLPFFFDVHQGYRVCPQPQARLLETGDGHDSSKSRSPTISLADPRRREASGCFNRGLGMFKQCPMQPDNIYTCKLNGHYIYPLSENPLILQGQLGKPGFWASFGKIMIFQGKTWYFTYFLYFGTFCKRNVGCLKNRAKVPDLEQVLKGAARFLSLPNCILGIFCFLLYRQVRDSPLLLKIGAQKAGVDARAWSAKTQE